MLCWVLLGALAAKAATVADIRRDSTVIAVEKVLPSVVNISTLTVERADPYDQMLREFFGYGRRAPDTLYSSGSGVIIDEEGWVVTNFHVVREAAKVQVTVADIPEPIDAEVVATSEANDVALIRLKGATGRKYKAVALAADDDLLLGETVIALGNPYGLGGSVSRGILSSKTRRAERDGESMEVEDWLQTDAAINPGNSGGPLVNLRGELIGINVAILAQAQGIGFAIPMKRVATALAAMFSPENTRGLWFGATVRGSHPPVVVSEIQQGSPAETAGLEVGDEIQSVDGVSVKSFLHFYREVGRTGREAKLGIARGEKKKEITVALLAEKQVFNGDYIRKRTGFALERIPEDMARQLRLDPSRGLLVTAVDKGGPADKAGIQRGHLVAAVDGQRVVDVLSVAKQLNRRKAGEKLVVDVLATRRRGILLQLIEGRAELRLR